MSRRSRERSERLAKADKSCNLFLSASLQLLPGSWPRQADLDEMLQVGPGTIAAASEGMPGDKRFVYIIRSERHPDRRYTGLTSDIAGRISLHNTAMRGPPWTIVLGVWLWPLSAPTRGQLACGASIAALSHAFTERLASHRRRN